MRKTVPKPTVVAAKRSAKRAGPSGFNKAPQRNALTTYDKHTSAAAAARRYGFE